LFRGVRVGVVSSSINAIIHNSPASSKKKKIKEKQEHQFITPSPFSPIPALVLFCFDFYTK